MSPVDFGRRELSTALDTLESPLHFLDAGIGPYFGGGLKLAHSITKSCFGSLEWCSVGSLGRFRTGRSSLRLGNHSRTRVSAPVRWFRRIERVSVQLLPQSFGAVAGTQFVRRGISVARKVDVPACRGELRKGVLGLGQFAVPGHGNFHLSCSFEAGLPAEKGRTEGCGFKVGLPAEKLLQNQLAGGGGTV